MNNKEAFMKVSMEQFCEMLVSAADLMEENSGRLSEIDSKFGDGDHGITVSKIAKVIKEAVETYNEESLNKFLTNLGDDIMCVNGGSAGPLYGTMIGGLGEELDDETEIDGELMKSMLQSSLAAMEDITTAKIGDKTMMDALINAVEYAKEASDDIKDVLEAAKNGAIKGAKDSENYVSKFGRAKSYKEATIGTPDAGAVSTSLFFEGLYNGLKR